MTKLGAVVRKFFWSLQRRGFIDTLKLAISKFRPASETLLLARSQTHRFDLKHGGETSGRMDGVDLLSGHDHDAFSTAYWGVSPSRARQVLRRWIEIPPKQDIRNYTFIDFGCGKGRMLLLASELPFREVVGVELNGTLAAAARRNAEIWTDAGKAVAPIKVLQQDATELPRPTGACLFYLYNPFGPPVLHKLLERLEKDADVQPGDSDFIYLMPEFEEVFDQRGGYSTLWRGQVAQDETSEHQDDLEDVIARGGQPCSIYRR